MGEVLGARVPGRRLVQGSRWEEGARAGGGGEHTAVRMREGALCSCPALGSEIFDTNYSAVMTLPLVD